MTIRKGEAWGSPVERPEGLRIAASDAAVVRAHLDDPDQPIGLSGGDLFRSLGSPPERSSMQRLPIDLLRVSVDGADLIAVAHVVMRRSWWRGPVIAVMNTDRIADWNVAPRAHPNDGRMDIVTADASMSIRHRWQARRRLATGTHVPHPRIDVRTASEQAWSFPRPMQVWADGVHVGDAVSVTIVVDPDASAVVI